MEKPFDINYVAGVTLHRMRKSIDMSIKKTYERTGEFQDDPKKSSEVFKTLSMLHSWHKVLNQLTTKQGTE